MLRRHGTGACHSRRGAGRRGARWRRGADGRCRRRCQPATQGGDRVLQVGSNIIFRERISTSSSGSTQLIFIDKTTLSVGPNSNILIDEFVYNPNAGSGRMTVTLTKGAMRMVGGNVSHTQGATIKTPLATIGVRGGVATVTHEQGGHPSHQPFRHSDGDCLPAKLNSSRSPTPRMCRSLRDDNPARVRCVGKSSRGRPQRAGAGAASRDRRADWCS